MGGVGVDISTLRPNGTATNNSAKSSTGAVSFMERFSYTTREVAMNGRRGALMLSIDINHPDVMDFIKVKRDGTSVTGANISVRVNNEFMEAVSKDSDWNLYDPAEPGVVKQTLKAKDLWKKILTSYFESGSPFLCFKDTANRANPNSHIGKIRSSNLCTEIFQNTEPNHYMIKLYYGSDENDYITVE